MSGFNRNGCPETSGIATLRAAELHQYGMIGVGAIFNAYCDGVLDADDEVAVVWSPEGNVKLTEALVDIRSVLSRAAVLGILSTDDALVITRHAQGLPYSDRTWASVLAVANTELQPGLDSLRRWLSDGPTEISAKLSDAREALHMVAENSLPEISDDGWTHETWHHHYLNAWIAQFRGVEVEDTYVSFAAILQHQQIYDPDFPRRWRHFVLSWIAHGDVSRNMAEQITTIAESCGVAVRHLSLQQLGYWLTTVEMANVDDDEKLLRLLVRAVPHDRNASIWPSSADANLDLLNPAIDSANVAAASFRRNDEIARGGPRQTIWHLRASNIRQHLAQEWQVEPINEAALTASARDRGFDNLESAVDAARAYFLFAVRQTAGHRQRNSNC